MQGHRPYGLSEQGKHQAKRLARRLASEFEPPSWVYCSPLQRAKETTRCLLEDPDSSVTSASVIYSADLAEGTHGIFEGLTWEEAYQRYPALCEQLEITPDWVPIPGAETPEMARQRAQRWMRLVLDQHQDGDRIWAITHEWILYHLVAVVLGSDRTWQFQAYPTGIFEFTFDHSQWQRSTLDPKPNTLFNSTLWQIRRFNDIDHL